MRTPQAASTTRPRPISTIPSLSEGARKSRADFAARLAAKSATHGQVQLVNFGPKSKPLPQNTFDFALSARSVHGWMGNGMTEKVLKDLHGALKPGGILAIEQHRANPGEQDPKAASGYVTEAYVIEQAQKAGFELVERSEINANRGRHQGPPVRRVDAAAHQAHASVQRRSPTRTIRSSIAPSTTQSASRTA